MAIHADSQKTMLPFRPEAWNDHRYRFDPRDRSNRETGASLLALLPSATMNRSTMPERTLVDKRLSSRTTLSKSANLYHGTCTK
ncbi:unnamed protein product [Nesidiocoris tenuis]|uniref:Uncharacterized protein n=1 Tax=Nesidiocoris tenuis TaxID=355587 RepID=A0A6H5HUC1_9HEMI|nr:unnamed protein product [Nesidiocoris tenuis]